MSLHRRRRTVLRLARGFTGAEHSCVHGVIDPGPSPLLGARHPRLSGSATVKP